VNSSQWKSVYLIEKKNVLVMLPYKWSK
jgi:hypothetical protein